MRRVGQVLPAAMENSELLKAARAQAAMRRWSEVVGVMLAERSFPDRFGRGTVWVAVEGSAWAQELRMMKDKILKRLNEVSGEPGLFTDVRFGVRPLPSRPADLEEPKAPAENMKPQELSIREIAEQRLAKWKDEGRG
jgi:predicted nucleic acid-binding Zn ribbon protein